MSLWTAIVLIVAIAMGAEVIRTRINARAGIVLDDEGKPIATQRADEEALRAEIGELKERIKVLERIATDDRKRLGLADEIESLRDS